MRNWIGWGGLLLAGVVYAEPGDVMVNRYTVVAPVPTADQRDPLETIVRITFPPFVSDLGGAVDYLLARSGYRLADAMASGESQLILLRRPLPASQRTLGPMSLRRALETLGGEAFWLVEDPVHRLVAFEIADDFRPLMRTQPMAAPGVQSHASEVTVIPLTEPDAPPIGMDYAAVQSVDDRAALATPPASYGPTGRGDSLGSIAQILVPDPSYSINQRMLAVFERNPHAFGKSDGLPNMNLLRAGETLTAPDGAALARLDREAARQEVARQYQAWQKAIGKGAIQ